MYGCTFFCYTYTTKCSGKGVRIMQEEPFKAYLLGCVGEKGVSSRMVKARKAERILNTSLDNVVADDSAMYKALLQIREQDNQRSSMQNAMRYYYRFFTGRAFPQLRDYERQHGLSTF